MTSSIFELIRNGSTPHPWQSELASDTQPRNRLIRIPTGMGKTLGVLSTWLTNRVLDDNRDWPTRLVWCLPMRTLVEQTRNEAEKLIDQLVQHPRFNIQRDQVDIHVLMGGMDEDRWYESPERPAILIGTQDMLLSRALNRGYAMGRAAWPRAFGLLNNDALWVMDEVQLMGVGLATSSQIQAFWEVERTTKKAVHKPRITWWMSATLQPDWLNSPETAPLMPDLESGMLTVNPSQRNGPQWEATKSIERVTDHVDDWPDIVVKRHQDHAADPETGRQTLVVLNTVKLAREVYGQVRKRLTKQESETSVRLIHSRFRPADRESWVQDFLSRETLGPDVDRILIATQVVEAGVDISASCLMTELAPWPSLVQRFGRAARYRGSAEVIVLDQEPTDEKKALPYSLAELDAARRAVDRIDGVAIGQLEDFEASLDSSELADLYPYDPLHVLLRDEFEELFDTSPDLSGADMDISRFIREGEERDVHVFWRDWDGDRPRPDVQPNRRELCAVPVGDAKIWIKKVRSRNEKVWRWDYLEGQWIALSEDDVRAGQVVLVKPTTGGYSIETGFTGEPPKKHETVPTVEQIAEPSRPALGDASDSNEQGSEVEVWKTIATHCREAAKVATDLADKLAIRQDFGSQIEMSLWLHDWGKAHPSFARGTYLVSPERTDLAKAPQDAWRPKNKLYDTATHGPRIGFRHELASCLAAMELLRGANPLHPAILGRQCEMLSACGIDPDNEPAGWHKNGLADALDELSETDFNLVLYLIASHHGKVRVSMQASPKDQEFPFDDAHYAGEGMPIRGVREGDELPNVALSLGEDVVEAPTVTLSLALASMGLSARYGASWSERVHGLLTEFGPFTLAYLEAVVRTADGRASDASQPPGSDPDPLLSGIDLTIPPHDGRSASENASHKPESVNA